MFRRISPHKMVQLLPKQASVYSSSLPRKSHGHCKVGSRSLMARRGLMVAMLAVTTHVISGSSADGDLLHSVCSQACQDWEKWREECIAARCGQVTVSEADFFLQCFVPCWEASRVCVAQCALNFWNHYSGCSWQCLARPAKRSHPVSRDSSPRHRRDSGTTSGHLARHHSQTGNHILNPAHHVTERDAAHLWDNQRREIGSEAIQRASRVRKLAYQIRTLKYGISSKLPKKDRASPKQETDTYRCSRDCVVRRFTELRKTVVPPLLPFKDCESQHHWTLVT